LNALALKERTRVVRGDVVRWLDSKPDEAGRASVVFLDPPYEDVVLDRTLKALDRLLGSSTVIVEHSRRQSLPSLSRLEVDRERRYGDTMVTVLRVRPPQET
jgi:16S rRNA G966 N2-methylase RsmD